MVYVTDLEWMLALVTVMVTYLIVIKYAVELLLLIFAVSVTA